MKRSAGAAAVSSSPGRAENLPAPPGLAAMLRGKSGSRRTSVARSSPMFVSRSRSVGASSESRAAAAAAEGEPSSPKVTCIGQVRIRSKKRTSIATAGSKKPNAEYQKRTWPAMRCRCLEWGLLCRIFRRKPAAGRPRRSLWRRWSLGFRSCGQRLKALEREEPDLTYPPPVAASWIPVSDLDGDEEDAAAAEEEEEEKETRVFMPSATSTPPKNALLLMRCRSAPHNRSSSLALNRFAVLSPAATGSSAGEEDPVPEGENHRGSCSGGASGTGDGDGDGDQAAGPVVLTRCKSEPARTATEKMVAPEETAGFWNNGSGSRRRQLAVVREENGHPLPILTR